MLDGDTGEVGGHVGVDEVGEPLAPVADDEVDGRPGRAIRPRLQALLPQHAAGAAVQMYMPAQGQVHLRHHRAVLS